MAIFELWMQRQQFCVSFFARWIQSTDKYTMMIESESVFLAYYASIFAPTGASAATRRATRCAWRATPAPPSPPPATRRRAPPATRAPGSSSKPPAPSAWTLCARRAPPRTTARPPRSRSPPCAQLQWRPKAVGRHRASAVSGRVGVRDPRDAGRLQPDVLLSAEHDRRRSLR